MTLNEIITDDRIEQTLEVVGAHAEGEVGNVVLSGVGDVPGDTMAEKSDYLKNNMDHIRRTLLYEPRGAPYHAANIIFPSKHPDADAGFVLLQVAKYSSMSGNNLICVATVLLEKGIIPMKEPETKLTLETPAGLIQARCQCADGKVEYVEFQNAPCFVLYSGHPIEVEGFGTIRIDVAYGGVIYALVESDGFDLSLTPDEAPDICEIGKAVRNACNAQLPAVHPENNAISGIVSVVFTGPLNRRNGKLHARNVTVVNRGRLDRCACGTGTCARLAVMYANNQIKMGEEFYSHSITNTHFMARVVGETQVGHYQAIVPTLRGRGWITGSMNYTVDPRDPISSGHMVPDVWS